MTTTLILGDCLEKMKDIGDNTIDIIIADLPYGRLKLEWDIKIDFDLVWEQIWRVCKPKAPVFLFGDFKFAVEIYNSQSKYFRYEIVWNKKRSTTHLLSHKRFGKATEYILVFYKEQPVYNIEKYHSVKKTREKNQSSCSFWGMCVPVERMQWTPSLPLNVIECYNIREKKVIKKLTEKPQEVLKHLLKYFSNEGDTCLDFVMGSGSCGVACKELNRNFIGFELNKEYCNMSNKRLQQENLKSFFENEVQQ